LLEPGRYLHNYPTPPNPTLRLKCSTRSLFFENVKKAELDIPWECRTRPLLDRRAAGEETREENPDLQKSMGSGTKVFGVIRTFAQNTSLGNGQNGKKNAVEYVDQIGCNFQGKKPGIEKRMRVPRSHAGLPSLLLSEGGVPPGDELVVPAKSHYLSQLGMVNFSIRKIARRDRLNGRNS